MKNIIRMTDREWSANLWSRIKALFGGLDARVSDIETASYIPASQKGAADGVAELDNSGHVPSSQLPSYVDDVLEYSSRSDFPTTGEAGKIYVAIDANMPYRWTGSTYVEIASGLALGETSSTAYRGDRGKAAYDHAQAHGSAFMSGLYKITTNAEGHVTGASAVVKQDITDLGIPGAIPAETDPTVPAWAKAATKPVYTAQEVGALPDPYNMQYASLYYQDNGLPEGMNSEHKDIEVQDEDGRRVGYIRVEAFKNGDTKISVYTSNFRNMGNHSRGIEITQKKDGSVYYSVDEPDQFRLAIQAQENVGFYIDEQGYICQRISSD